MANSIKDIMTTKLVAIDPKAPLLQAVELLMKNNFNGLPVVDKRNKLVGIVTDRDMIVRGTTIHVPTFMKLMQDFQIYKKDSEEISDEVRAILKTKVKDIMNPQPFRLQDTATIVDAIDAFTEHHRINPIPIVDAKNNLVGLVSRYDVLKLYGSAHSQADMKYLTDRDLDKNVGRFLNNFGKQFLFVSKTRTRYWLLASLAFALIGFLIAFLIIVRLTFN